jgi:hypothetical protein
MNWEAIAAVAEAVGAAGVILTLIYLALQIRQNTASVRAASLQGLKADSVAFSETLFKDPDLVRIWSLGLNGIDSLQDLDRDRFHLIVLSFLRRFENIHQLSDRGLADEEWHGFRESFFGVMSRNGIHEWWSINAYRFNPTFRAFIEHEIERRAAQQGAAAAEPQRVAIGT